jgi:CheY-like chemotaxis protein
VRVQSEVGRGTTVLLDLPLSLALLRVVLVEMNGESAAIPTAAIRRILQAVPGAMAPIDVIDVEGAAIPLASLATLLGQAPSAAARADQTILVIEARDSRLAVIVDAVLEEQELVFQELRGPLGDQLAIAGAALLGNGDIVPILDVQALHERIVQPVGRDTITAATRATSRVRPARVLVVEDSLVAAEMHRGILAADGYEVEIAHDGVEALEMLRRRDRDIVITDLDMPNMDGIALTAHLRSDDRLQDIPIVIVSSRDTAEHRRRGLAAGADAYVTKGEFDQHAVLATVRQLVGARPRGVHR